MSASIVFHLLAALAYGVLTAARWRPLARGQAGQPSKAIGRLCVLGAIGLHGAGIALAIIVPQGLHLGWALALSTAVWLGMIVFWIENFLLRIDSVLLLLLPAAAVTCLLAAAFPQGHLVPHANSDALRIHLLIAMMAYGLMTGEGRAMLAECPQLSAWWRRMKARPSVAESRFAGEAA